RAVELLRLRGPQPQPAVRPARDPRGQATQGRNHVSIRAVVQAEFHVEDVDKAADHLVSGYGFRVDEIHPAPRSGALLVHGGVRLALTRPPEGSDFLARHGDAVAGITVLCDDPQAGFARARAAGAVVRSVRDLAVEVFPDFS